MRPDKERRISNWITKREWFPVAISASPGALILAVLLVPSPIRSTAVRLVSSDWGNIASAWGLGVSIYLISIARAARTAAQEARSAEKVRSALEGLEQAAEKNTQLGLYARNARWDAVQIRAEEVMNCCHSTVARWKDDPAFKESCNDLLMVATQMHSIILEAAKQNTRPPRVVNSQVASSEKLSAVIGRIQREQDTRSE